MIKSKVSSGRSVLISGVTERGEVKTLDVICVRKNLIRHAMSVEDKKRTINLLSKKCVIGFVSHPTVVRSNTGSYVNGWCHPFRSPEKFINPKIPTILLSESDFVDPEYIKSVSPVEKVWDFFCFTLGGEKNRERKGTGYLVSVISKLCLDHGLNGIVINYSSKNMFLNNQEKRLLRKCRRRHLCKCIRKKLTPLGVANIMCKSRFGLFPNILDCSPLMLCESLVRDVPVLVNPNILGGWKYVNSETGLFFDLENVNKTVENMMSGKFSPRRNFLQEYGFKNSSIRFAEWGRKNFKEFRNINAACFSGLSKYLTKTFS